MKQAGRIVSLVLALVLLLPGAVFFTADTAEAASPAAQHAEPARDVSGGDSFALEQANRQLDYIVQLRRELHRQPEVSMKEFNTSKRVQAELASLGIEYTVVDNLGVIGIIRGTGGSSRTVALRADMDALAIREMNDVPYKSQNEGVMHACGHDAHMAMLLGAAKILQENRDKINGTVKLIFQPAEEIGKGARLMVKNGALQNTQAIFGIHQDPLIPAGEIRASAGEVMSAVDFFSVKVTGKAGHGATPHETVDALVASAAMVQSLQTIVSREINPALPAVVTIGKLNAGSRANIVAGTAEFQGTVRFYSRELRTQIENAIKRITKGIGDAYRVEVAVTYEYGSDPVDNDPVLTKLSKVSAAKVAPARVKEFGRTTLAEDFAIYQNEIPGVFVFLGTGSDTCKQPLHSDRMNLEEQSLSVGAAMHVQFALDYLNAF